MKTKALQDIANFVKETAMFDENSLISFFTYVDKNLMLILAIGVLMTIVFILTMIRRSISLKHKLQRKVSQKMKEIEEMLIEAKPIIGRYEHETLSMPLYAGFTGRGSELILATKNILRALEHRLEDVEFLIQTNRKVDLYYALELLNGTISPRFSSLDSLIRSEAKQEDEELVAINDCKEILTKNFREIEYELERCEFELHKLHKKAS